MSAWRLPALVLIAALSVLGCARESPAIVGAWYVKIPKAPYPVHLMVFHADGTVIQSNPDAGHEGTSDSNMMGAWRTEDGRVIARLIEATADRATHQFVGRIVFTVSLNAEGEKFSGNGDADVFDANGKRTGGMLGLSMDGERIDAP